VIDGVEVEVEVVFGMVGAEVVDVEEEEGEVEGC